MHPFPESATRREAFTLENGQKVGDEPLMRQEGSFRYLDGGSFTALELPYQNGELSMVIFLPNQAGGLDALEQTLTAARMRDALGRMTVHEVDVTLPRFKMTAEFRLREPLARLGMPLAFSNQADFTGAVPALRLNISDVFHKVYVEVNEKGTEAAAATGSVMRLTAYRPVQKQVFRADHPFFFAILEKETGSLLFAGRLANPGGS